MAQSLPDFENPLTRQLDNIKRFQMRAEMTRVELERCLYRALHSPADTEVVRIQEAIEKLKQLFCDINVRLSPLRMATITELNRFGANRCHGYLNARMAQQLALLEVQLQAIRGHAYMSLLLLQLDGESLV